MVLGRMAIDKTEQGKGLGKGLLKNALLQEKAIDTPTNSET